MDANNTSLLSQRFPELKEPELVIERIADAFVAPEYARAAFGLMRRIVEHFRDDIGFGQTTVVTAPYEYEPVFLTIAKWWFLAFHTASLEELSEGEDVEEVVPLDFSEVLRRQRDELEEDLEEGTLDIGDGEEEDDDEDEFVEETHVQVGTFLLDSTIMPHEELFDREDLDFYAFDFPEDRIEAERFYLARMVWEPGDLANEDLMASLISTAEFLLGNFKSEAPYAEYHDSDFAQLVLNESLCERAIGAAEFGDIISLDGETE